MLRQLRLPFFVLMLPGSIMENYHKWKNGDLMVINDGTLWKIGDLNGD